MIGKSPIVTLCRDVRDESKIQIGTMAFSCDDRKKVDLIKVLKIYTCCIDSILSVRFQILSAHYSNFVFFLRRDIAYV